MKFLSTLSLRRATVNRLKKISEYGDFYPRSPCGERRNFGKGLLRKAIFLSTLSLRRATRHQSDQCRWLNISIHALLAESDRLREINLNFIPQFLSTLSLRRATQDVVTRVRDLAGFLSTLSLRRATRNPAHVSDALLISIHALLAESDLPGSRPRRPLPTFLSTLSLRRATKYHARCRAR